MNIGSIVLLALAALCELIATFNPGLWAVIVKNWMTLGFAFVILSWIVVVTITVSPVK